MKIKHNNTMHENVKISKCGKYFIASNNFTKFKLNKCEIIW